MEVVNSVLKAFKALIFFQKLVFCCVKYELVSKIQEIGDPKFAHALHARVKFSF